MIYKINFYTKEAKQAYIENRISRKKIIGFAVFMALCSFALYFLLQTLQKSVVSTAFPEFMAPSYFSSLSLYLLVSFVFYLCYFIIFYEYLTFAEISKNKWYCPIKMGFSPIAMIFIKMGTRLLEIIISYSLGFLGTIFLTAFLKFPFNVDYMFPLYFAGLIDIFLVVIIAMTFSLFISDQKTARYVIAGTAVVVFVCRVTSGYYTIMSDRALMRNFSALFDWNRSPYMYYCIAVVLICCVLCVFRARNAAAFTSFPFYAGDMDFGKDVKIVTGDGITFSSSKKRHYLAGVRKKALDVLANILLIGVVVVFIAVNVLVLIVTLASSQKEITFFGQIPYVFQSETMEPAIMFNDLAFFQRISDSSVIQAGDIVLYRSGADADVSVARVTEKEDMTLKVDIDYYPAGVQQGIYEETIESNIVYGVYTGRSRWLGALILFANTIFGRLLFLLIPAFLIFYYKPILKFFKRISTGGLRQ